ncbi:MAG: DUF4397 domain-containing protein [Acidobacteria bacterium]|nr:DUF4397 domain-containing protein [Acidobacteriota bacterium]
MLRRTCVLFAAVFTLTALTAFTTSCGSSSTGAKVRLVNGTPDEAGLDLLIDTKSAATSVAYGASSSYITIATGTRELQIEPTGATNLLADRSDSISAGTNYTLLSMNFSFDPQSVLLIDDNTAPDSGNFKLRVINASPGMGIQDVYIVPDGTDISSVDPTFPGLAFQGVTTYSGLAAGDYHVIFAVPGQKFINLDSGKITFASRQIRTALGLNNPVGGFEFTMLTDAN